MRYLIKTEETELWNRTYLIEADSEEDARKKLYTWDTYYINEIDDKYCETTDRNILEIYEN